MLGGIWRRLQKGMGKHLVLAVLALMLLDLSGVGHQIAARAASCSYNNPTRYDPQSGTCGGAGAIVVGQYLTSLGFWDYQDQRADTSGGPSCLSRSSTHAGINQYESVDVVNCSESDIGPQYKISYPVHYPETATTTAVDITIDIQCTSDPGWAGVPCISWESITMTATGGLPKMGAPVSALPAGAVSAAYSQSLAVTGGIGTISYALSGTLPRGLSFDGATGLLSGTPTQAGTFPLSFTATDSSPAGSGGPQKVSNTQLSLVITGTSIAEPTTTTLDVSNNPAQPGQTVTFSAQITKTGDGQRIDGGSVDFTEGSTVLCAAALVRDGSATCDATFATTGLHTVTASFTSSSFAPSSGTVALTVTAPATGAEDAELIGSFQSDRANLIVSHLWNMGRNVDRLNAAQGQPTQGGQAPLSQDEATSLPTDGAALNTAADPYGLQAMIYGTMRSLGDTGTLSQFTAFGPINASINTDAGLTASFHTSLSEITRAEDEALGLPNSPDAAAPSFDIWAEGSYAGYGGTRSGQFGLFSMGGDYVVNPNLLLGVFAQIDSTTQTSGTPVSGTGWMAGPYATVRLTDNLFWQSRLAAGGSANTLTGSGDFTSSRWLASSELDGHWALTDHLDFAPGLSFTYFQDTTDPYTNLDGAPVTSVTSGLGQLRFSPSLSYGFKTINDLWVEPSLTPDLIWNFGSTDLEGLGLLPQVDAGPTGLRGRLGIGLGLSTPEGISLTATGFYDGIGADGYSATTAQVRVHVPLN